MQASPLDLTQAIEQVRRRLKDEGIQLIWGKRPDFQGGGASCEVLAGIKSHERDVARESMLFLHHALEVYPPGMLARLGLTRVVLCREIWAQNNAGTGTDEASGVADNPDTLLLAPLRTRRAQILHTFHHELGHLLDTSKQSLALLDKTGDGADFWRWLEQSGVTVTPHPEACMPDGMPSRFLVPSLPGYVSRYAVCDPGEDFAETFAMLVEHPADLTTIWATDPVVHAKGRLLRARLRRQHGDFDDAFWARAAEHGLDPAAPPPSSPAPLTSAAPSALTPQQPPAAPSR